MIKPEKLKKFSIFSELTDEDLNHLKPLFKEEHFKKDELIIHEGDFGQKMYLLADGMVEICKSLTLKKFGDMNLEGREKTLILLRSDIHPFFGEMGLLTKDRRSADVIAREPVILYSITKEEFELFCSQQPQAGNKILFAIARMLSLRLAKENNNVLKLTTALSIALRK